MSRFSARDPVFLCHASLSFCVVGAHVYVNSISSGFLETATPRVYKTMQIQEIKQVKRKGESGQDGCFPPMCSTTFSAEW